MRKLPGTLLSLSTATMLASFPALAQGERAGPNPDARPAGARVDATWPEPSERARQVSPLPVNARETGPASASRPEQRPKAENGAERRSADDTDTDQQD